MSADETRVLIASGFLGITILLPLLVYALYWCPLIDWLAVRLGAADLTQRELACWCPLDRPCHADVLLELSNK